MFVKDKINVLIILAVFSVILLIMLPFKDQLFSEDFAYAQSVRHLIGTGELKISERVAPTSITHIIYGSIFAKIFGFSLANLHFSVVMLIPFLLVALYKLFILTGCGKQKSLIFTLFFLSIPWILQLSFTFLTDNTYLTLEVLSLLFYLKGLKNNAKNDLLLGSIFASSAFLTRQLGFSIVAAAVIAILLRKDRKQKHQQLFASLIVPCVTFVLYYLWLSLPGNTTIAQYSVAEVYKTVYFQPGLNIFIQNISTIIHKSLNFVSQSLAILFPLVFLFFISNFKRTISFVQLYWLKIVVITTIAIIIYTLDIINFRSQYTFGFPLLIYDYEFLSIPWPYIWKYLVLLTLPVLSYTIYLQFPKVFHLNTFGQFILISFIFLSVMTLIHVATWDQYVVPLLPVVLLWIATLTKKLNLNMKVAYIVVIFLLLDSLQMTKVRYDQSGLIWKEATNLVNAGVSPLEIDANNNFGWFYWHYFEKLAADSINKNHGNKRGLKYGFVNDKKGLPQYRIYTSKIIGYIKPDTSQYKITPISIKSLFVNSEIYFMEL